MNEISLTQATVAGAFLILTAVANAESVSSAADLSNNERTLAYINEPRIQESLYRLAVEQDKKFGLQQNCKSEHSVEPYSIVVRQPIEFLDGRQHPTNGIWQLRYQFQRCGESKFYNALFVASSDGATPPTARATFPGTTNAGPLLIKDTMIAALSSTLVMSDLKNCKEIDVFDMRVTENAHDVVEGGKTLKNVWNETWTFRLCGQMVDTEITFTPDVTGGGTTYTVGRIKPSEVVGKQ